MFVAVASGNGRQVLVSNCMSVDNSDPSFEVALNPQTATADIIGKSRFNAAQLSLPYDVSIKGQRKILYSKYYSIHKVTLYVLWGKS